MIYVGISRYSLRKRFADHLAAAGNRKSYFQRALQQDDFRFEVIDHATDWKALCEKEQYWIQFYNCRAPKGYNLTDGGDGCPGLSEETRLRMREALLGSKRPSWYTPWNKGKKMTKELSDKMAKSRRGINRKGQGKGRFGYARIVERDSKGRIIKSGPSRDNNASPSS